MKNRNCIIVTGGAGFIGSAFSNFIKEEHPEYSVVVIDNLSEGSDINRLDKAFLLNDDYYFYQEDIRDLDGILKIFSKHNISYIVNFAALTNTKESFENVLKYQSSNFIGTAVLLEASRNLSTLRRFHQVSTDEVYGELEDKKDGFIETDPLNPKNPYSASKAAADSLVISFHHSFGFNISISRLSKCYGPNQDKSKLIPSLIDASTHGRKFSVYGDGNNTRNWIYIKDAVNAIDKIVFSKEGENEIFNVGGEERIKTKDLVYCIVDLLGAEKALVTFESNIPGRDKMHFTDISKIKQKLSWRPKHNIQEKLFDLVIKDRLYQIEKI